MAQQDNQSKNLKAQIEALVSCVRSLSGMESSSEFSSEILNLRSVSHELTGLSKDSPQSDLVRALEDFAAAATPSLFLQHRQVHSTLKLVTLALKNPDSTSSTPELIAELSALRPSESETLSSLADAPKEDIDDLFRVEANELLDRLSGLRPKLASDNKDLASINDAMRTLRSLEGAALAVELPEVESTCGKAIELFQKLAQRRTVADLDLGSLMEDLISALREVINQSEDERWTSVGRLLMLEGRLESLASEAAAPAPSLAQVISAISPSSKADDTAAAPVAAASNVPAEVAQAFRIEIEELATRVSDLVLQLEQTHGPARDPILEELFRDYHSLKGAARAAGYPAIETLCQATEGVLVQVKRGKLKLGPRGIELLYLSSDTLISLASLPATESAPSDILQSLELYMDQGEAANLPKIHQATSANTVEIKAVTRLPEKESVRVPVAKLGNLSVLAEEMLSIKLGTTQRAADLKGHLESLESWGQQWNKVQSDVASLRRIEQPSGDLERVLAFMGWSEQFHNELLKSIATTTRRADTDRRSYSILVENLLEDSKRLLTFPLASLLQRYPKVVRDLCRDLGKSVALEVEGAEVEIDRRIIERLQEPVLHLVRNALDHGFETPEVRVANGKPAQGTLKFHISPQPGNQVQISIIDDGRGIDIQRLKEKAVSRGLVGAQAREMDDREAVNLIFLSDLSTSESVTEISGRGLGMPIVREQIKRLGGSLRIETVQGKGTQFHILLPLTLSTFRGILVKVSDKLFVVPTVNTERVVRVHRERDVRMVEGDPTISINGRVIPLLSLASALGLPTGDEEESDHRLVLVFESGIKQVAYYVSEILSEQEVLVRRLQGALSRLRKIVGISILGTGDLAPIVNAPFLVENSSRQDTNLTAAAIASVKRGPEDYQVLLADDSLTSRTLIKYMLESAGYRVRTAADGVEALAMLRSGQWDLLVSDIEMPRMNGLELARNVRQDANLSRMPIILVSTLDKDDDKARGLESGANAYIVKGTLDQEDLIDHVRQLL